MFDTFFLFINVIIINSASLTNGTLLILDTLDNEILGSHTFPNGNFELTGCYSINDEV